MTSFFHKKSRRLFLVFGLLFCAVLIACGREAAAAVRRAAATCKPVPAAAPAKPLLFVPGSWTMVLLPDTQIYSRVCPGLFTLQADWIVRNKAKYNIRYVMLLGDITDGNTPREWENARNALSRLDGQVPYAVVMGNHDCTRCAKGWGDRETPMNSYFHADWFKSQPTFGGVMKEGRIENAYYLFSAGHADWLIVVLEWAPRDEVVAWANSVCAKYPQRKAILVTHAYMYYDNSRYDFAKKGKSQSWNPHEYLPRAPVNDGEELWNKLVRKNNFAFTFNGHVLGSGTGLLSSKNDLGKTTHQMLVNYQMRPMGGEGYLRLIEMLPDGKTVHAKSYSPLYDTYLTQPNQQFTLTLD
jgi:uncharacterized protein YfiM (DUF2279 family)